MKYYQFILLILFTSFLSTSTYAKRYALLVGIDKYAQSYGPGTLHSCINDANGIRNCLLSDSSRWLQANINILTDTQAKKDDIRTKLTFLSTRAKSGDIVLYFHSSHGGNHSGTDAYLCSYNANYEDYELAEDLAKFKDGVKIIVVLDSCYSGGMYKGDSSTVAPINNGWNFAQNVMNKYAKTSTRAATKSPSIAWITACNYNELSLSGVPYSLFTEKALFSFIYGDTSSNGTISFKELFEYAQPRVKIENKTQTVQYLNGSLLSATEIISVIPNNTDVQNGLDLSNEIQAFTKPGPKSSWRKITINTHDGIDAAQSGAIGDNETSECSIRLFGPGTLSFWWKTSSSYSDYLNITIDNNTPFTSISGIRSWEKKTIKLGPGEHFIRWIYKKDSSYSYGLDCGWVDQVVFTPAEGNIDLDLANAIDAPTFTIKRGGNKNAFRQTTMTQDGIDAAKTGNCSDNQTSWFTTTVTGPGTISFWWKVSSELKYDHFDFSIDGETKSRISGEQEWAYKIYIVEEGEHTIGWGYTKDSQDSSGSDCGWVDQMVWLDNIDADGDGLNNVEEYIAGTDPTDPTSCFKVTANNPTIEWTAMSNRIYRIYYTENLEEDFQLLTPTEFEAPTHSYTDPLHNSNDKCFYKMDVRIKE
jgi:hypothetical protein